MDISSNRLSVDKNIGVPPMTITLIISKQVGKKSYNKIDDIQSKPSSSKDRYPFNRLSVDCKGLLPNSLASIGYLK